MFEQGSDPGAKRVGGLLSSLKNFAVTFVGIVQTRLQLLVNEIEEEASRVTQLLLLAALAVFCIALTIVLLTVFIIVAFWDTHPLMAIGGCALFYLIVAIALINLLRKKAAIGSNLFKASLAELDRDLKRLRG